MTAITILAVLALAGAYTAVCAYAENRALRSNRQLLRGAISSMADQLDELTARLDALTARTLKRHKRRSEANVRGWQTRKGNKGKV